MFYNKIKLTQIWQKIAIAFSHWLGSVLNIIWLKPAFVLAWPHLENCAVCLLRFIWLILCHKVSLISYLKCIFLITNHSVEDSAQENATKIKQQDTMVTLPHLASIKWLWHSGQLWLQVVFFFSNKKCFFQQENFKGYVQSEATGWSEVERQRRPTINVFDKSFSWRKNCVRWCVAARQLFVGSVATPRGRNLRPSGREKRNRIF